MTMTMNKISYVWDEVLDIEKLLGLDEAETVSFDGPRTSHILGKPYITFVVCGEDKLKVISQFVYDVKEYIMGATQIAWRLRPTVEMEQEQFKIRARCYAFNGDIEWEPKVELIKVEESFNSEQAEAEDKAYRMQAGISHKKV